MLRQGSQGEKEVAHDAAPPSELLFEEHRQGVRYCVQQSASIVDVSPVTSQQCLVGQEPVLPLIYGNPNQLRARIAGSISSSNSRRMAKRHPLMQQILRVQFSGIL